VPEEGGHVAVSGAVCSLSNLLWLALLRTVCPSSRDSCSSSASGSSPREGDTAFAVVHDHFDGPKFPSRKIVVGPQMLPAVVGTPPPSENMDKKREGCLPSSRGYEGY
jgi:hypothetical protein